MKKNVIFAVYLILVITLTTIIFRPDFSEFIMVLVVTTIGGSVRNIFSLNDKKEGLAFKIIFLIILNTLIVAFFLLVITNKEELKNFLYLSYNILLSTIGLDLYIIYSCLFEKNKKELI